MAQPHQHQDALLVYLKAVLEVCSSVPVPSDWKYVRPEDLLMDRGRWFQPHPLPGHYTRGTPRRCYLNAYRHARTTGSVYVEGYALDSYGFGHPHAWCSTSDGRVEDVTWQDEEGLAYLGIGFAPHVLQRRRNSDFPGLLTDLHSTDFQILRHGIPAEDLLLLGEPHERTAPADD
ncbi:MULTISPECIES: hypothetical protein [unclassified Crossiella]|uniref:hypothetical protein n=1 Tax=unclassified Crossiella TaxID=2620835 RepID=UPI001FFFA311|nr:MULTISPECIES: hypothetical protein [unclassified Crossiella]MCK2240087.1 hypothetical protein [Crossiella sp. S99.2]MCK2252796.1 hypothetical protein [Crossiella sp. S99.1]